MKTHIRSDEVEIEQIKPGMRRQILGYDSNLMLVRVYFDTGVVADKHTHPHQQVSYVEKGKFEVEIDGHKEMLKTGDCFVIPSEALHGAICLEEGSLIDTFSPRREDFLEPTGGSGY
ncbi:MAG: cupin domain-containing protein [Candidatus Neomarinimicrobiota bacterium]